MPIYEYSCAECREKFELIILNKETVPTCPTCGSQKLFKLLPQGTGIFFKGNGFYSTSNRENKERIESAWG